MKTTKEQVTTVGNVAFKPMQRDMFSGELVKGKPKAGNGRHIRLKGSENDPPIAIGMAHFPGSGPEGKYCHDCGHYGDISVYRGGRLRKPSAKPSEIEPVPKHIERGACIKAAQLFDDVVQKGGIGSNRSCKYFVPR